MSQSDSENDRRTTVAIGRILDANANRVLEGFRVVEDYLRFALDDAFLSRTCKQLRHDVSKTLSATLGPNRFACRSTTSDVGTTSSTASEYSRHSVQDVAEANLRRVAESLRTLEEYIKLRDANAAREFEAARYQSYTLEKAIGHLQRSKRILEDAHLYVLIDLRYDEQEMVSRVRSMQQYGASIIQLREKSKTDREVLHAARVLRQALADSNMKLVINDRPDIAAAAGACGVHVGQEELTVVDARKVVGPDALVGVSTHSLEQAQQAILEGADYIGVGPVFPSQTKTFENYVGLSLVEEVSREITLPAFNIGGITRNNVASVVAAGGNCVAIGADIWQADDVAEATQSIRSQLPNAATT